MSKKGKKSKKPKDTNAPKRPQSSYFLFMNEIRPILRKKHPNKSMADISKLISVEWKKLKDKTKYIEKAAEVKEIYKTELEEYQKTNNYQTFQKRLKQWKEEQKQQSDSIKLNHENDNKPSTPPPINRTKKQKTKAKRQTKKKTLVRKKQKKKSEDECSDISVESIGSLKDFIINEEYTPSMEFSDGNHVSDEDYNINDDVNAFKRMNISEINSDSEYDDFDDFDDYNDIESTPKIKRQGVKTILAVKPLCQWGAECYRKNAQHFKEFGHPIKDANDLIV
eukprot:495422_1